MNECHFIGRFTADPELKKVSTDSNKDTSVVNFTLAINRKFRKNSGESGKHVVFLPFEAWDTGAEVICNNFCKGDPIIIERSSARNNNFQNSDGIKVSKIVFRVEKFQFPSEQGLISRNRLQNDSENHEDDNE